MLSKRYMSVVATTTCAMMTLRKKDDLDYI